MKLVDVCISRTIVAGAAFALLFAPSTGHAQTGSISAPELPGFLGKKLGPVLDARLAGDCPENRRLARSAIRIGLDFGTDADSAAIMSEDFLARVAAQPRLVRARLRGATILVVCCGGVRAKRAAELLSANGYKAMFVSDGLASTAIPDQVLARVRK